MTLKHSDLFREIEEEENKRNAYASIEGYLFQFELLLYHIMVDGTSNDAFDSTSNSFDWKYYVEEVEDYSRVFDNGIDITLQVGQIKYHSGYAGDSEYYEAVLWLYFNYLRVIKCGKVTTYKSRIFHYDTSPQKGNILDVLNEAILKAISDIRSGNNSKSARVLRKINKLSKQSKDNKKNRRYFSKNSSFNKVHMDRDNLIRAIKGLIPSMFPIGLSEETIYSGLVVKLIKDGKNKTAITLKDLQDYLSSAQFIEGNIYTDLIISSIYYFCSIEIASAVYESTRDEIAASKYESIGKRIFIYLKDKLTNAELRRSFLHTAIYDTSFEGCISGSIQEWELFLQCKKQIQDLMIKLSNILYAYEIIQGEEPNLDDWFIINNNIWLFKCPWEKRGNGILISDSLGTPYYNYLSYISKRYENADIKPNVWYFSKKEGAGLAILGYGKDAFEYRVNITKPDSEWLAFDKVDNAYFYLECLYCLNKDCFDDCQNAKNVFEEGCINA